MTLFHRFSLRGRAAVACLALLGVALYWSIPRKADLRTFDPAKMAALETASYRLTARAAPGSFDVDQAAKLELDWWQATPGGRAAGKLRQNNRCDSGDCGGA